MSQPEKATFIFTKRDGTSFRFRCVDNQRAVANYLKKLLKLKNDAQLTAAGAWKLLGETTARASAHAQKHPEKATIANFRFAPGNGQPTVTFRAPNHPDAVHGFLTKRGYDVQDGVLSSDAAIAVPSVVTVKPKSPPLPIPNATDEPPAMRKVKTEAKPRRKKASRR